ncbi:hypothetical protein [Phreatobacter stygius]|uniref:Uncharacterized protein n=1 Tax=Phreatobacter stygius TaxID=1940610 RepID=A0A4D7AVZ2_9HYPH|nr:hypothetical protein [Phreatobacter stygius]QCI65199.1 hypothetical protein E8M01_13860 [Phreatobacter stygius]
MDSSISKILAKLDKPPSAPNWVRFIGDDEHSTAKAILRWIRAIPPFTYQPAARVCKDRIELGISLRDGLTAVDRSGAPAGRGSNSSLVRAFFEYDQDRRYSARNPMQSAREYFRVSRDILVPVEALSVIVEERQIVPVFLCGWSKLPLTTRQRRLLVTIYEDAYFSLTDFQNSPGEMLFFPKSKEGERDSELWMRGDYQLLTDSELREDVEKFILARDLVRKLLVERHRDSVTRPDETDGTKDEGRQPDLFRKE